MNPPDASIKIVPANEASCDDLRAIFGTRGAAATCQCQRYKLQPLESFYNFPAEERAHRLRTQTEYGNPGSDTTSGLVAYLDGEPVGWCAIEPRTAYTGLVRNNRVPWEGRNEDKSDATVWAITCLFVRVGFRKRGISRALPAPPSTSPATAAPAPSRPTRSTTGTSSPRSSTSAPRASSPTPA